MATPRKRSDKNEASETSGIARVIESVRAKFGDEVIMRLGAEARISRVETVPTGSIGLDRALGTGGLPLGRIVEIYGPESSGKTTLTLHLMAEAQKKGLVCAFIDAEHALDPRYAAALGVRLDELLVSQPDYGEQALALAEALARTGSVRVIVVDSVAALVPKNELEGEMGDHHVGAQARLMSQAMRKLAGAAMATGTMIVFINQLRMKIGVTFGSPETTTGGNALRYFSSVRLDIRRIATVTEGDIATGNRARVKVAKNKLAPPFTTAEFEIAFGRGIDRASEILDLALARNVVQKAGSWFTQGDRRLGHGRGKVLQWLRDNPGEADALLAACDTAVAPVDTHDEAA
jgi:recombination protein RecA